MKQLQYLTILVLITGIHSLTVAQNIETEGSVIMTKDLNVGGGYFEFWDDFLSPTARRIDISNNNGDLEIRTLGAPGGRMTLKRNGELLLENDDNDKIIEFKVPDAGGFRLNDGEGGTARLMINANGTMAVGSTSFDSQSRMVIKQGPSNQRALLIEDDGGEFWTVNVDNLGDYNWRHRNEVNFAGGVYIDASDSYALKNFSDRRLKSDIEHLYPVLDKVLQLQAKKYFFISNAKKSTNKSLGFIAQEVEELFPELVSEKDGFKALSYSSFGILAIKALQEQQQLIEKLEQRIRKLEN